MKKPKVLPTDQFQLIQLIIPDCHSDPLLLKHLDGDAFSFCYLPLLGRSFPRTAACCIQIQETLSPTKTHKRSTPQNSPDSFKK